MSKIRGWIRFWIDQNQLQHFVPCFLGFCTFNRLLSTGASGYPYDAFKLDERYTVPQGNSVELTIGTAYPFLLVPRGNWTRHLVFECF